MNHDIFKEYGLIQSCLSVLHVSSNVFYISNHLIIMKINYACRGCLTRTQVIQLEVKQRKGGCG